MAADQYTTPLDSFIRLVVTATSTTQLYSMEHPQIARLCNQALENLSSAMGDDLEISLMAVADELIVAGRPLFSSMHVNRFSQMLKARGIGHIRFLKGLTDSDLRLLITILSRSGQEMTEVRSSERLRFGRVDVRKGTRPGVETETGDAEPPRVRPLTDILADEVASFREISEQVRNRQKLTMTGISDLVTSFVATAKQDVDPILALALLPASGKSSFMHPTNVCILNLAQAMSYGIEGQQLHDIGVAAMLHDIGKLFVPEDILTNQGKLDSSEWALIEQHPVKGALLLLDTPGVPRLAVVTAYEHHLNYNLSGYPQVTSTWRQNFCSHMTTISDVFDRLRSTRLNRGTDEFDAIATAMRGMAGRDLHPLLTQNFLGIVERLSTLKAENSAGE